jgi:drug/metabolite transporter (DMT)-like permease
MQLFMSTGYLAALATIVCWTISIFVTARLTRLEDAHVLNKAILFFSIFLLGILVCVLDGLTPWELFTVPSLSEWLGLGISGILGKSIGDYCGIYAMRILGPRRRTMTTTLTPGFMWLFGLIILKETLNWLGIVAMLLTIVSLLLLINSRAEKDEVKKENFGLPLSGLLFGIAGAVLTALAFVIAKKIIKEKENISAFHGTWMRIITAFAALMLFDIMRNKHVSFIKQFVVDRKKGAILFFGILFGTVLGLSFSLIANMELPVAVASTMTSMVPVPVIFVSVILYKKKITLQSWFYSILAIGGIVVLLWRDELIKYFW